MGRFVFPQQWLDLWITSKPVLSHCFEIHMHIKVRITATLPNNNEAVRADNL